MDLNEYQELAQRTANPDLTWEEHLDCGAMGMCGEAGEFIDHVKKHKFQGHLLDRTVLIKELGDVLWYAAEAASALGYNLDFIAERNIAKLRERYPLRFTTEESINRKE